MCVARGLRAEDDNRFCKRHIGLLLCGVCREDVASRTEGCRIKAQLGPIDHFEVWPDVGNSQLANLVVDGPCHGFDLARSQADAKTAALCCNHGTGRIANSLCYRATLKAVFRPEKNRNSFSSAWLRST